MQALTDWPPAARARVTGVFTDIDDTLTTHGGITSDALTALTLLKESGVDIIAITGRPVGWSEPFARSWPINAIVAENGAVLLNFLHQNSAKPPQNLPCTLSKSYCQDGLTRRVNGPRLRHAAARVLREVPGSALAQDSGGRETDIAIDHSEFAHLSPTHIAEVVRILHSEGLHATVSSIHINGWLGTHNKLTGAHWAVHTLLGRDLALEMDRWVFIGDSTNDQLMFEAFDHSVGVANVRRFEAQLYDVRRLPHYITHGERGAGFAEVARALLAAR
jgi:hypothetical protein